MKKVTYIAYSETYTIADGWIERRDLCKLDSGIRYYYHAYLIEGKIKYVHDKINHTNIAKFDEHTKFNNTYKLRKSTDKLMKKYNVFIKG